MTPREMALGHVDTAHVGQPGEILTEAARYAYSPAGVGRTLLEKQHSAGRVFRQSIRQSATGRSGADDDIVK